MGLGITAGEQAFKAAKALQELYQNDDQDGDDEELVAMTDSERD